MTKQLNKKKSIELLIPVFGTLLFVVLYIIATLLYPGGSQVDKDAIGFSWVHNYWCNLINEKAINGQDNPAKPFAMAGMFVICVTVSYFWMLFPRHFKMKKSAQLVIQISGLLAMTTAFFLFTNDQHDFITNLSSFFGVIALFGTLMGLYQKKWFLLLTLGLLNLLLVGLNNYCYYHQDLIHYLPIIQKISFASFLIWICCIDVCLYHNTEIIPSK
jgi:hypothetical protein